MFVSPSLWATKIMTKCNSFQLLGQEKGSDASAQPLEPFLTSNVF